MQIFFFIAEYLAHMVGNTTSTSTVIADTSSTSAATLAFLLICEVSKLDSVAQHQETSKSEEQ